MSILASIVVVALGLYLIWLTGIVFAKPALAERVLPTLVRHMRLYALGLFAFGALLLYGVFSPGLSAASL